MTVQVYLWSPCPRSFYSVKLRFVKGWLGADTSIRRLYKNERKKNKLKKRKKKEERKPRLTKGKKCKIKEKSQAPVAAHG